MNVKQVKTFWVEQSDKDWEVARSLFNLRHYAHALFYCHLSLEKLLKAVIVQETKKQSPYSHDLLALIEKVDVDASDEQRIRLNEITTFNVRARYDDIKYHFYKKATKKYATKYMEITKKLRIWLKRN